MGPAFAIRGVKNGPTVNDMYPFSWTHIIY